MINSTSTYLAITLVALILLTTRLSGAEFMSKLNITPKVEAFLESMSGSVIVAIVANEVVSGGLRTLTAVVLTGFVLLISKNSIVAMLFGIGCAAVWTLV